MTMLAEYGTMSLAQVLGAGHRDGRRLSDRGASSSNTIEHYKDKLKEWPDSRRVMLPHLGHGARGARARGDLPPAGSRRDAAQAGGGGSARRSRPARTARPRSTPPTTASTRATSRRTSCARVRELGGLFTLEDLANWKVKIEEPVHTSYKGIEVYKLTTWVQGPVMLQTLNILENFDLKSMGYDSARYIHTLYQAMNLAYADRDFYYGDPAFAPVAADPGTALQGLRARRARSSCAPTTTIPTCAPGIPYPFQGGKNPSPSTTSRSGTAACRRSTPITHGRVRPHLPLRDHQRGGGGREGLGRLGDAERRLDAGGDRRPHRHRTLPAHAELRARSAATIPTTCSSPASARAPPSLPRWR